jgi:hypothetical protein
MEKPVPVPFAYLWVNTCKRVIMKATKPAQVREARKTSTRPKKKRNLDNSTLKSFFGKGPENVWEKDIYTGEGNFSF